MPAWGRMGFPKRTIHILHDPKQPEINTAIYIFSAGNPTATTLTRRLFLCEGTIYVGSVAWLLVCACVNSSCVVWFIDWNLTWRWINADAGVHLSHVKWSCHRFASRCWELSHGGCQRKRFQWTITHWSSASELYGATMSHGFPYFSSENHFYRMGEVMWSPHLVLEKRSNGDVRALQATKTAGPPLSEPLPRCPLELKRTGTRFRHGFRWAWISLPWSKIPTSSSRASPACASRLGKWAKSENQPAAANFIRVSKDISPVEKIGKRDLKNFEHQW